MWLATALAASLAVTLLWLKLCGDVGRKASLIQPSDCCGPAAMLEAFKEATQEIPAERVHFESFSAEHEASLEGGFVVELARSGKSIEVTPGQSILDVLLAQGIEVMNSCREGICGACEVPVLEGTLDHRDSILSDSEKQAGKSMFVCCSGSLGNRLVLDL